MLQIYDNTSRETLLSAASRNTTTTGTGVDLSEYIGEMGVTLVAGAGTGGGTCTVKLQESASLSSGYTDISSKAFAAVEATGRISRLKFDTRAVKKYVRAVATIASWTGVCAVYAEGVKQNVS